MLVEKGQYTAPIKERFPGLLDMVAPVAAGVLKGGRKTPLNLIAVYLRQAYAWGTQAANVIAKMPNHEV